MKLQHNNIQDRLRVCTIVVAAAAVFTAAPAVAQNSFLRQGNKLYEQQKYDAATQSYMQALKKDPNNATGLFNLGNALYQKKQFDSSRKVLAATAGNIKEQKGKSAVNYNIGNTYMAQRQWKDAIDAYKKALKNNPQDADAKYNLAYARQMMKKEEQQSGGGKDKEKNKEQQQKDKQQQDNKEDKQDKSDKGEQNPQPKDEESREEQQKAQSSPSKLSEEQAEKLLNALQQEEKKLQDKMKKQRGAPARLEKDW